jgi:hypothetical protein
MELSNMIWVSQKEEDDEGSIYSTRSQVSI